MRPTARAQIVREVPFAPHERPWLFTFLIAPDAVISLGLVSGALSYLLRNEGVNPARAASIVALLSLPHAIYFLWGPLTDFFVRRRTWLMARRRSGRGIFLLAFHQSRLGAPGRRSAVSWRVFRRIHRCRLRRYDGHATQRNQSPPRRQFLPERLSCLRRRRCLCAGFALRPPSTRLSRLDRRRLIVLPSLAALAAPAQPLSASTQPAKPPRASGRNSNPPFCAGKPFPTRCSSLFPCAVAP